MAERLGDQDAHQYVQEILKKCEEVGGQQLVKKCTDTINLQIADVLTARGTQVSINTTSDQTLREALGDIGPKFFDDITTNTIQ